MRSTVVVGAGRAEMYPSVGSEVVAAVRHDGRRVEAWDVDESRLEVLRTHEPDITTDVVDASDPAQIVAAFDRLGAPPGAVVNCVAMTRHPWAYMPFERIEPEQLEREMSVSLVGASLVCVEAARRMAEAGDGAIVTISSVIARQPAPFQMVYAMAKRGLEGLTRSLATEFGPHGVRTNAIAPGLVQTEVHAAISETAREGILAMFTGGVAIAPSSVADVVLFLVSERARHVNGQVIDVDTGFAPFRRGIPSLEG